MLECYDAASATLYDRTYFIELRDVFSYLRYVRSLRVFCHWIGAIGESLKVRSKHKNGKSETRASYHRWRGWQARLIKD